MRGDEGAKHLDVIIVERVDLTISNTRDSVRDNLVFFDAFALGKCTHTPQSLHLPPPAKPRQALLSGEELLQGGLLEVALLGDERVERGEQGVNVREGGGYGALFGEGWEWYLYGLYKE